MKFPAPNILPYSYEQPVTNILADIASPYDDAAPFAATYTQETQSAEDHAILLSNFVPNTIPQPSAVYQVSAPARATPQMLPPLMINKPTPPTPTLRDKFQDADTGSVPAEVFHAMPNSGFLDLGVDVRTLSRAASTEDLRRVSASSSTSTSSRRARRAGVMTASDLQITPSELSAHTRAMNGDPRLQLDYDGSVKYGTEDALIEHLTFDHSSECVELELNPPWHSFTWLRIVFGDLVSQ